MEPKRVEKIAQGRVWTGRQAKRIGLVDELGGLDRAIAYCQLNYSDSGQAKVISWPPKRSILEAMLDDDNNGDFDYADFMTTKFGRFLGGLLGSEASFFSPTVQNKQQRNLPLVSAMSETMLMVDENSAIHCLMQEQGGDYYTDILSEIPPGFLD